MQYVVQPGDSPWSIAWRFTGRSTRWGELVASNPHKPRARDGSFLGLAAGEVLRLPPGWPSAAHGRSSLALGVASPSSPSSPSSDAGAPLEERPPRPLETSEVTEKVTWLPGSKIWGGGEYTSDLRYFRTRDNHNANDEWWNDRAWDLWVDMAEALKADPETLLLVAFHESVGLRPWIVGTYNKRPFAWGFFQITPAQHSSTGLPKSEYERFMSLGYVPHTAEQQIPHMWRYWEALSKSTRKGAGFAGLGPGAFYAYNAAPARVGDGSPSNVLYSENPADRGKGYFDPTGYGGNRSLDLDKDGRITIGELGAILERDRKSALFQLAKRRLDEALARRGRLPTESPVTPRPAPRPAPSPVVPPLQPAASGGLGPLILLGVYLLVD